MMAGSMEVPPAERLARKDKSQLAAIITRSCAQHPTIQSLGGSADNTDALVNALVDFYWTKKSLLLCGIRMDEGLACGSLSVDAREDPSLLALARLAWAVTRVLGREALGPLLDVEREKPLLQERHLEMVILATVPEAQRQGFGRSLLHFLYRQALRDGYGGILLVTDEDTPSFGLYLREGFEVEREFAVAERQLCWMRRTV
jgi:ribosomal protein S18 acetylase RimI-like enzyme